MPRRPKPFFHRGWWVTNAGGARSKLAKGRENKSAAEDALLDLMHELRTNSNRKTFPQLTVFELCDLFLDWVETHRAKSTYDDYRRWLAKWVTLALPVQFQISKLLTKHWQSQWHPNF